MRRVFALVMLSAVMLTLPVGVGAQTGTFLSFVSDPGDYIGGGQTRLFTPDTASFSSRIDDDQRHINVTIFPFDGGFWYLDLAAPQGQQLVPGVYEGATRWPFQAPTEPGLSFFGDGRGCNTLTGRFQVFEAVYGPLGYVQRFHATFEQHCEGATAALRGEVLIDNPPPPPPLALTLTVNPTASVNRITGAVTLSGTVTCSTGTTVNLFGILRQRANRFTLVSGSFGQSIGCSPTPKTWTAEVSSDSSVPFNPGMAQVDLNANAFDQNYGTFVTKQLTTGLRIVGSR